MIDLHTHSTASDGTDTPERIVELAAAAQCQAVALTDHDTLEGLSAAKRRADELGVTLVRGCEVSCAYGRKSMHVLVYFVDGEEGPLHEELRRLRHDRVTRNRLLADRLVSLGLPITYDEVVAEAASEESVGRPHFGIVLTRNGATASVADAFDRWLSAGRPAHVSKARVPPAEVAELARRSAAVTVVAHPLSLGMTPAGLASAVAELSEIGVAGIEAFYGRYSPEERQDLARLARRHGLVATGGSDHHGATKPDLTVGTGRGDLKVPDQVLHDLTARRPD